MKIKFIKAFGFNDIYFGGVFSYRGSKAVGREELLLPEVMFEAFNGQYMKVAIGKGLITVERLGELFARYGEFFE